MAKTVSAATLRAAAEAALDNAQRLLKDAEMLWSEVSVPTAHSLAILAAEEAAKARIWWRLAMGGHAQVTLTQEGHRARLGEVHRTWSYLDAFLDLLEDPDHVGEDVRDVEEALKIAVEADNSAKQRGFYVDVEPDGVRRPTDVGSKEAREALRLARLYIGMLDEVGLGEWD